MYRVHSSRDPQNNLSQTQQYMDANDMIKALERRVGVARSGPTHVRTTEASLHMPVWPLNRKQTLIANPRQFFARDHPFAGEAASRGLFLGMDSA
jgi:hypothetical protein